MLSRAAGVFARTDNRHELVLRGAHPLLRTIAAPVRGPWARGRVASDHEFHGEIRLYAVDRGCCLQEVHVFATQFCVLTNQPVVNATQLQ